MWVASVFQEIHLYRGFPELHIMIGSFISHERTSMSKDAGFRVSRLEEQKQRARRVRIGVMIVLCALPMAMALAHPAVKTLVRVSVL
jgi:hypothetical protein